MITILLSTNDHFKISVSTKIYAIFFHQEMFEKINTVLGLHSSVTSQRHLTSVPLQRPLQVWHLYDQWAKKLLTRGQVSLSHLYTQTFTGQWKVFVKSNNPPLQTNERANDKHKQNALAFTKAKEASIRQSLRIHYRGSLKRLKQRDRM